ncbi:MAG: hypothetical protein CSA45_03825 [Gammaproteobacteria bacterium]|nr:MAG: hypothetical protein CSA45_03825 [Gammaproteobacteria bacterium]
MNKKLSSFLSVCVVFALGCVSDHYESAGEVKAMKVEFSGGRWNGKTIPKGQQCRRYGGKGNTPPLTVIGVPKAANAIIVEYNDLSYSKLSSNGGHGKIGYWIEGDERVNIPAIRGETKALTGKSFLEANNRSGIADGYLPPCSGGRGNTYEAVVKAVYKPTDSEEKGKLLGMGRIILGKY